MITACLIVLSCHVHTFSGKPKVYACAVNANNIIAAVYDSNFNYYNIYLKSHKYSVSVVESPSVIKELTDKCNK